MGGMQSGSSLQFWQTILKDMEHSLGADLRPLRSHDRQTWKVRRTLACRWQRRATLRMARSCTGHCVLNANPTKTHTEIYERQGMGQGMSDQHAEDDKVKRVVEALDEMVWDDSVKIDFKTTQEKFIDAQVNTLGMIKKAEAKLKDKHAEQTRMHNFYKSKSMGDPGIAGLEASSNRRVGRYDIVLSYIYINKVVLESKI